MTKGDLTKARILSCASQLFTEKGFTAVTMKDICEATGLSRGGLYRYFGSTSEMMLCLMEKEQENADIQASESRRQGSGPLEMLEDFLNAHRRYMMSPAGRLELAMNQFAITSEEGRSANSRRLDTAVKRLRALIEAGQAQGVFREGDSEVMALHVMLMLGALREQTAISGYREELVSSLLKSVKIYILK